ncbi:MAG: deoxyguanosinetriphosphate triphosphohydrolase [Pseudomonadota bacterium]
MTTLAPYASNSETSRGRRYEETPSAYRSEYQRDRDRIIHAKAFRRLEYKTQVFVNHEGDLFRTRLTHSLEAAQLGRTIARALNLNEDLVEAIALAHDLGHTPFGHAGQDALNKCMKEFGGFEHNLQSLRVVDELEHRYPDFDGLNLTFETREGILKHCSKKNARQLGDLGERFLEGTRPSLEAQVTNVADEVAYNNHDIDDGLRAGMLTIEQLQSQPLFKEHFDIVMQTWPKLTRRRAVYETIRRMINAQINNLIDTSRDQVEAMAPKSPNDARNAPDELVTFSASMYENHLDFKRFLNKNLYRHYRVHRMTIKAQHIVSRLFEAFINDPHLMPGETQRQILVYQPKLGNDGSKARVVADYIAGMTDRYAIDEYERLFDLRTLS